jgi:hypothetical protein
LVDTIASKPLQAHSTPGNTMIGTGLTMEAIEQNPVMARSFLKVILTNVV